MIVQDRDMVLHKLMKCAIPTSESYAIKLNKQPAVRDEENHLAICYVAAKQAIILSVWRYLCKANQGCKVQPIKKACYK